MVLYVVWDGWLSLGVSPVLLIRWQLGLHCLMVQLHWTSNIGCHMADDYSCLSARCSAGFKDRSTNTWFLLVAWASHTWVLRKKSPLANIPKDTGGSGKAFYGLPCITSASFYGLNMEGHNRRLKDGSLEGHFWRLTST